MDTVKIKKGMKTTMTERTENHTAHKLIIIVVAMKEE